MKKVAILLVVLLTFSMLFAGIAFANETKEPAAPDTPVSTEAEEAVAGDQTDVVVPEEPIKNKGEEEDYVGKDVVLEEGQMGITSVDGEAVYDESIAYSALPQQEAGRNNLYLYGAGALFVALAGFVAYKRVQVR